MPEKYTKVIRKVPIETIIPAILLDILRDTLNTYAKEKKYFKPKIVFGYIEDSAMIAIEVKQADIDKFASIMTHQGHITEAFLIDYYKISREDVYNPTRKRELILIRQTIQFFLSYYASMTLANVGMVTGKKDHATILSTRKKIFKKMDENDDFKKEMILLDLSIANNLAMQSSIFDSSGNYLTLKNHSK
jgi:hypothetical protein